MKPATGAARKPAEPRPIPIISPRPEDAPSGMASMMDAYITGKGELRKTPQPIRMIQPSAPLLIKIMAKTVTAQPTARMLRDHLRLLWSETVPQKIWPIHPVMPEAPATTEAAARERPASLVSCSVRNETTPVSAHKNRKFAATENLTLRAERASFIASHAVARGLSSRSAASTLSLLLPPLADHRHVDGFHAPGSDAHKEPQDLQLQKRPREGRRDRSDHYYGHHHSPRVRPPDALAQRVAEHPEDGAARHRAGEAQADEDPAGRLAQFELLENAGQDRG